MNDVHLLGRLTTQPELKTTTSGISVCQFVLAVPRSGGSEQTDFLPVTAWRQTAEFCCRNLHKGERIALRGTLTSRSYTSKDGQKRTAYEVVAEQIEFADAKRTEPAPQQPHVEDYVDDETPEHLPF